MQFVFGSGEAAKWQAGGCKTINFATAFDTAEVWLGILRYSHSACGEKNSIHHNMICKKGGRMYKEDIMDITPAPGENPAQTSESPQFYC